MKRFVLVGMLLCAPTTAWGQPKIKPTQITLRPVAAPVPALRYPLLPELREMESGNAAMLYYRAFSPEWQSVLHQESVKKSLRTWGTKPKEMPPKELRFIKNWRQLQEVDRAARRTYCDWEREARLKEEGIALLLPDVQSMRSMARNLVIRALFEIQDGEHHKVIRTLQTGFAMGRHVANAPTLIEYLVGMAISGLMLDQIELWIESEGSPNLYWSLSHLPRPLLDIRKALQGERIFIDHFLPGMREQLYGEKIEPWDQGKIQQIAGKALSMIQDLQIGGSINSIATRGWAAKLTASIYVAGVYPGARKHLKQFGLSDELLDKLPLLQVVLLNEIFAYDQFYDELQKWSAFPPAVAMTKTKEIERRMSRELRSLGRGAILARLFLPAMQNILTARARFERRIAALRCIEALRLHAAANQGRFPEKLSEIKVVPVPEDPILGKAFKYTKAGDRAALIGPAPEGEGAHSGNTIHYEMTLKGS